MFGKETSIEKIIAHATMAQRVLLAIAFFIYATRFTNGILITIELQ